MQVAMMFFHVDYRRLVGAVRDEKTATAERCKRPTHMSNLLGGVPMCVSRSHILVSRLRACHAVSPCRACCGRTFEMGRRIVGVQPRTRCSWEITDFFCANRFSRGEYYTHLRASPGPRNSFADALFTQGLMALMQPIICCVSTS